MGNSGGGGSSNMCSPGFASSRPALGAFHMVCFHPPCDLQPRCFVQRKPPAKYMLPTFGSCYLLCTCVDRAWSVRCKGAAQSKITIIPILLAFGAAREHQ